MRKKKKLSIIQREWMVVNGSIYTADMGDLKLDFTGKTIQVRNAIAFNVGETLARHIVNIHNNRLDTKCIGSITPVAFEDFLRSQGINP